MASDAKYIIEIVTRAENLGRTGRQFVRMAGSARQAARHVDSWKKSLRTWIQKPERMTKKVLQNVKATQRSWDHIGRAANGMSRALGVMGSGFSRVSGMGWGMARSTAQTATNMSMTAGSIAIAAGAAGIGALVTGAIRFNAELEKANAKIATSLLLYDVFEGKGTPSQQLDAALGAAGQQTKREFDIAARSPASYAETTTMSSNMMAGYVGAVGWDPDRYNRLLEPLTTLGMLSGDAATFGSQMGRMFSGGAGAESETYRQYLAPVIAKEGGERGFFKKGLMGGDLTAAFNKLDPEKRVQLIEAAAERLGPITERLAYSWMGLTGTVESVGQVLLRSFGESTFEKIKQRMMAWVAPGGILDPASSMVVERLKQAAQTLGAGLERVADWFFDKAQAAIIYTAANWEAMLDKAVVVWDKVKTAAEVVLKAMLFKGVAGTGMGVMGSVGGMATGAGELVMNMLKLGKVALIVAPLLAIAATLFAAFGVALAGVGAYIAENWQAIVSGITDSGVDWSGIIQAINDFWAKLVAVGEVFLGLNTPFTETQEVVDRVSGAIKKLTDFIGGLLRAAEYAMKYVNWLRVNLNLLTGTYRAMLYAVLFVVDELLNLINMIPGASEIGWLADASWHVAATTRDVKNNMIEDFKTIAEIMTGTQNIFGEMADAWEMAFGTMGQGPGGWAVDFVKKLVSGGESDDLKPNQPKPPKNKGGANVNINKVVINQDLRNHDPDRIVGAMYQDMTKKVMRRTQALTLPDGGS